MMTLEDDAHRRAVGRLAVRVIGVVGEAVRIDLNDVAELVEGSTNPKGGPVFVQELGRRGSDEPGGWMAKRFPPSSGNSVCLQF